MVIKIIDIETIPGENPEFSMSHFASAISAGRVKNPLRVADAKAEKLENIMDKVALTPVASRILCAGIITLDEPDGIDSVLDGTEKKRTWSFVFREDMDEKELLLTIKDKLRGHWIVTFNGRNFDFPFMSFRAAVRGVPFHLPMLPYNGRDNHIDLFQHLNTVSNLSMLDKSLGYISLKRWINYFNIDIHKPSIKDGEIDLVKLLEEKKYDEIEEYVKGDVMATYELFQRFRGNFNLETWRKI